MRNPVRSVNRHLLKTNQGVKLFQNPMLHHSAFSQNHPAATN